MDWYDQKADEYVQKLKNQGRELSWDLVKEVYIAGRTLKDIKSYEKHREKRNKKQLEYYYRNKERLNKNRKKYPDYRRQREKYMIIRNNEIKKFCNYKQITEFLGCSLGTARKIILNDLCFHGWEGDILI